MGPQSRTKIRMSVGAVGIFLRSPTHFYFSSDEMMHIEDHKYLRLAV